MLFAWKIETLFKLGRDIICRRDVVNVYNRARAATACHSLEELQERIPFAIRAIQVDGGIKLFILSPRSVELNGYVERAHRTHTEEFCDVVESSLDLTELREKLLEWEQVYNTVRPHQASGYETPLKFLERRQKSLRKENVSLII